MAKLRRTLASYQGCTANAVATGSKAQMMYFVEDAKADIASLSDALRECQQTLAMMIQPGAIQNTTVLQAFAAATEAEAKARALIGEAS